MKHALRERFGRVTRAITNLPEAVGQRWRVRDQLLTHDDLPGALQPRRLDSITHPRVLSVRMREVLADLHRVGVQGAVVKFGLRSSRLLVSPTVDAVRATRDVLRTYGLKDDAVAITDDDIVFVKRQVPKVWLCDGFNIRMDPALGGVVSDVISPSEKSVGGMPVANTADARQHGGRFAPVTLAARSQDMQQRTLSLT